LKFYIPYLGSLIFNKILKVYKRYSDTSSNTLSSRNWMFPFNGRRVAGPSARVSLILQVQLQQQADTTRQRNVRACKAYTGLNAGRFI